MFYVKTQVIPRNNTLFISVIKTDRFMLCKAKVAVCSEVRTKHTDTV